MNNLYQIIGNIGTDLQTKKVNDKTVLNFTVATQEKWKDDQGNIREHSEWHNVQLWGNNAKTVAKYANKGDQIALQGKHRTREYEKDGVTKYFSYMQVAQFQFLKNKSNQNESPGQSNHSIQDQREQNKERISSQTRQTIENKENESTEIDDLPF